jgi:hypothetical protein
MRETHAREGAGRVQRRAPRSAPRIAYQDRLDAPDLQTAARSSSMGNAFDVTASASDRTAQGFVNGRRSRPSLWLPHARRRSDGCACAGGGSRLGHRRRRRLVVALKMTLPGLRTLAIAVTPRARASTSPLACFSIAATMTRSFRLIRIGCVPWIKRGVHDARWTRERLDFPVAAP